MSYAHFHKSIYFSDLLPFFHSFISNYPSKASSILISRYPQHTNKQTTRSSRSLSSPSLILFYILIRSFLPPLLSHCCEKKRFYKKDRASGRDVQCLCLSETNILVIIRFSHLPDRD
ncbi:hypothetical protein RIF29_08874 [Crotalaria pallida]|uniref:Uncharacterized protein n=1 Tax=Crotalaria pallida TaxID=3830 RepID=A0AAN9FZ21_CROPI